MKSKQPYLILGLALLALAGCASTPSITSWDIPTVAGKTMVTRDDFKKITTIKSPEIVFGGDGVDIYQYHLGAEMKDGEEKPNYYLMLITQRGYGQSWAFWETASDQNGKEFKLTNEGRDIYVSDIVQELSSARMSREYLEGLRMAGVRWRVYGQRATKDFDLAPNLISGFLQKCDEQFGRLMASKSGP